MHRETDPAVPIRPATDRDASAILACLAAAFEPYRDAYTPGAFADTVLDSATLRRRTSEMTVLVAEHQGKIVGTIACVAHSPTGHLRGMAVLPSRQGTGVAAALLAAAEDHLRHAGCTRVTLDTTGPLQRAIAFTHATDTPPPAASRTSSACACMNTERCFDRLPAFTE